MAKYTAFQCKRGAESAAALAAGAQTNAERAKWEHVEKQWRTRWKQAVAQ
jgi:hypothetical protein